jgi:hypothetical protein
MRLATLEVLALAELHVNANASAKASAALCLADARHLYAIGDTAARKRAIDSLRYSVGPFHRAFERASA